MEILKENAQGINVSAILVGLENNVNCVIQTKAAVVYVIKLPANVPVRRQMP